MKNVPNEWVKISKKKDFYPTIGYREDRVVILPTKVEIYGYRISKVYFIPKAWVRKRKKVLYIQRLGKKEIKGSIYPKAG